MKNVAPTISSLALIVALLAIAPAQAAETQKLPLPIFRAWFTDASGRESATFSPGDEAVLNVTFALALSEVRSYPVTVTLQMGGEETQIYAGRLDEGFWNVSEKVKVKRGPWKVILKVLVTNRSEGGATTFNSYTTAGGTF